MTKHFPCVICKESVQVHNTCRWRACRAQLHKDTDGEIKKAIDEGRSSIIPTGTFVLNDSVAASGDVHIRGFGTDKTKLKKK